MQLITRYLKIITSRNCASREKRRRREGRTFLSAVAVTAFTRSVTTSAVQPSRAPGGKEQYLANSQPCESLHNAKFFTVLFLLPLRSKYLLGTSFSNTLDLGLCTHTRTYVRETHTQNTYIHTYIHTHTQNTLIHTFTHTHTHTHTHT